ncbi:MAG TPA: tetratricopeptide repeat protein [Opitutaceae bacterium]|jgi:tetratricopeptide (TPR) repeat protein|nr:tetratricopeptide repeat protein [Opitutaceae bacterium]
MRKAAPSFPSFFRVLLLTALLGAGVASPARAEDKPRPEISDKVSEKLQDLKPLEDASDWDGAIALVDSLLKTAGHTSYDRAVLSQLKANYLFQKKDPIDAIPLLETSLKLSDTYGYFDSKTAQVLRFYLSNLYYERGSTNKDHAAQLSDYKKAGNIIEKWLEINRTDPTATPPSADSLPNAEIFYASLLYSMAELDQPANNTLIKKSLGEVEKGLRSTPRPSENFYVIQLAALQQLGNYTEAADVLEQVLKAKPDNKTYWQQLTAFYINLANSTKDGQQAFEYNVRAIITIERAHQHGAMKEPKDNLELVGIYFNVGQYQQATELLEAGLHNGAIESNTKNWMLLSYSYQELHKDLKAVAILNEASELFPKSGQFDYQAAQILYSLNNTAEALKAIQSCVAKDGGEQPGRSWLFLSYLAYELENFDLAGQAVENAAKFPGVSPKEINNLREAVKSGLAQRAAAFQTTK